MENLKEKLRLRMQQKKEQMGNATPSTTSQISPKETEEQQIQKLNEFKEKKYLEEKEKQGIILEQTKNDIETLT